MAARHLKKLQEQLASAQQAADGSSGADDSDGAESPPAKAPFNPFALLSDDEVCACVVYVVCSAAAVG
jgi:hypothetical protein